MKTLILFITLITCTYFNIVAQSNWEHLGTLEIADIKKIVKDKNRFYSLTPHGIYYKEENDSKWRILEGALNYFGNDGLAVDDFYVSGDNIYLVFMGDTVRKYFEVSNDLGVSWNSLGLGLYYFENVKVAGDTIQFRSGQTIYYSIDGFKTIDSESIYDSNILPANDIDIFNPKYVMTSEGSLYTLENDFYLQVGTKILDLPQDYDYIQLINVDSLVFVWATDKKDYVLFRINPKTKTIERSLVFDYKQELGPSHFFSSSTYFKYEDDVISLVTNKSYSHDVAYVSDDLGQNWKVSKSFPYTYKEHFGNKIFINHNNQLFESTDNGETLNLQGKGILSHYNLKLRAEKTVNYIEVGYEQSNNVYENKPDEKYFLESEYLRNSIWVTGSDNKIYLVKDKKLNFWDPTTQLLESTFPINIGNEIYHLYTANDILFVNTKNTLQYSADNGKTWIDTQQKLNFSQIIFFEGFYFIIKDSDVFKSDNLTSWSQVDIINGIDYINSGYLWVVDDALFFMLNHNNFRYGKYNKLEGKFNMDRELPFWYNLHSSNNTTGLAMIDEKNIVSFKREQGLKFSDNYGFFWQDLDDFKGTFIYDIAVKDDYLYVLNTYGLWKRSVDFLTSTTRKDNTLILNDIRLIPNPTTDKFAIDIPQPSKLIDLKIINANGKTEISNLSDHSNIDISTLANGIYFVLLKTEDGISVNRLVKTD